MSSAMSHTRELNRTQMWKPLNPFVRLYSLAKNERYTVNCWRDSLLSVYRKSNRKRTIKEICFLFYALAKASRCNALKSLRIPCRMSESEAHENIGINDILDAYTGHLTKLLHYLNNHQLAMLAQSLAMLEKMDAALCSSILNRLVTNCHKMSPRSLCTLTSTFAMCESVCSDVIENILLDNKDVLTQMNKLDTLDLCRALMTRRITNSAILSIVDTKLNYYADWFEPSEVLLVLTWMCKMGDNDERLLDRLISYIKINYEKFDLQGMCTIARALSELNTSCSKDFLRLFIDPITQRQLPVAGMEVDKYLVLSFYLAAARADCVVPLRSLLSIADGLKSSDQWRLFFQILETYQSNVAPQPMSYIEMHKKAKNTSAVVLNTCTELGECWQSGMAIFLRWLVSSNSFENVGLITDAIVDSGYCTNEFCERLLQIVSENICYCTTRTLVDIAYNMHLMDCSLVDRLLGIIMQRENFYTLENCLKILPAQLFSKFAIGHDLSSLRAWLGAHEVETSGSMKSWILPQSQSMDCYKIRRDRLSMSLQSVPHDILCYCLASLILKHRAIVTGHPNYCVLENSVAGISDAIAEYKGEILRLAKVLRPECKWLQHLSSCIFIIDEDIYHEVFPHKTEAPEIPKIYARRMPHYNVGSMKDVQNICINLGDVSSGLPMIVNDNSSFVFLYTGHVCSRWQWVWSQVMRVILQASRYTVVEHRCQLSTVLKDMGFIESQRT